MVTAKKNVLFVSRYIDNRIVIQEGVDVCMLYHPGKLAFVGSLLKENVIPSSVIVAVSPPRPVSTHPLRSGLRIIRTS